MSNYTATTSASGGITVEFTNDASGRDVQVDYIQVGGSTWQAENQSTNTGVWQNGSCGGSNSEWLHCNGYIGFNAYKSTGNPVVENMTMNSDIFVYPNPAGNTVTVALPASPESSIQASVYNAIGALVKQVSLERQNNTIDITEIPQGMYIIRFDYQNEMINKKFLKN